ncbi:MAG: hypothetical protein H8D63_00730 [Parcubacteria group bacterium]|nr:hypothetical protein [Parcubacteria group bacterium]
MNTHNNKDTIFSIFVICLIALGVYIFVVNRDAHRVYIEETAVLLKNIPAGEVMGVITELSGDTVTLAVKRDTVGAEALPETLTYTITPETTIIRYVRVSDTEAYIEAMDRYAWALENDPTYRGTPPTPFEMIPLAASDLSEGQRVSVSIGITAHIDRLLAERIILRDEATK